MVKRKNIPHLKTDQIRVLVGVLINLYLNDKQIVAIFDEKIQCYDTRWSAGGELAGGDRIDSRYQRGRVLDAYTTNVDHAELYFGRSRGLHDGYVRRWTGGLRYDSSTFAEKADDPLAAPLPQDRTLVYPWMGLEWIEDRFATVRNQDQLARTEDLQFGRSARAELGVATPAWGADRSAAIISLQGNDGRRFGESRSLFVSGSLGGRWEADGLRDVLLETEARYYQRQQPHALFFASARGAVVEQPDLDHQLLLGGDNGLRTRLIGATRIAASAKTSTNMPPSPTSTTGPNCGSCRPPRISSLPPVTMGCSSTPSMSACG